MEFVSLSASISIYSLTVSKRIVVVVAVHAPMMIDVGAQTPTPHTLTHSMIDSKIHRQATVTHQIEAEKKSRKLVGRYAGGERREEETERLIM